MFVLSILVNVVLYSWSYFTSSRGSHDGVNDMIANSVGRTLTFKENLELFLLAFMGGDTYQREPTRLHQTGSKVPGLGYIIFQCCTRGTAASQHLLASATLVIAGLK